MHHIRSSLTTGACKTIVAAIVGSLLDYCNSLLADTSVSNLTRLQLVHWCWKYTCSGCYRKILFLPHHAPSFWFALASWSSQNKFQDCYYHLHVSAFQAAILSRCPYSTVCADTITWSFSLLICVPTWKTAMAKSKSFSSVASSDIRNELQCHYLSRAQASPLFECLPWYFLTIHWHHVFFQHNFCVKQYVPREPWRDPSNHRLNEHGIYIWHCQESNSQPVSSQAGADTTRPQWRVISPHPQI